jgi:hypothetical protein
MRRRVERRAADRGWMNKFGGRQAPPVEEPEDWGWHFPPYLVKWGAAMFRRTGRMPHPDEILDLPEDWIADVFQMDDLIAFQMADSFTWDFIDEEDLPE